MTGRIGGVVSATPPSRDIQETVVAFENSIEILKREGRLNV